MAKEREVAIVAYHAAVKTDSHSGHPREAEPKMADDVGDLIRRVARSSAFALRKRLAQVRSPLVWRIVYWLLARHSVVRLAACACRAASSAQGRLSPEDVAERISHLFLNGWPHHPGTPWINLNVSRFVSNVKRQLTGIEPATPRPARCTSRLRVGLMADIVSTLTFSPSFFRATPSGIELSVFDLGGRDRSPGYLSSQVQRYEAFEHGDTERLVDAIERADLDILMFDVYKADIYSILDGTTVPCVVDLGSTANLTFHPNVSFRIYALQQADYLIREGKLFCATSESIFDAKIAVHSGALLFEQRGIDPSHVKSWRERDPLIVYHGKLYKLSDSYLDAILTLLAADTDVQFIAVGRDDGGHLDRINAHVAKYGVARQFQYEGSFRLYRNAQGEVDDPSWLRVIDLLGRARLAPDPWPLSGGYSRVEAYLAGTPVVHMGVRTDQDIWRRPQLAVTADQPALEIPAATVYTVRDYIATARELLYNEESADSLARQQLDLALTLTDGSAYWRQITIPYRDWRDAVARLQSG